MSDSEASSNVPVALLDTTVQLDRLKMGSRERHISDVLSQFTVAVTTCISLLEFKATLIKELVTIHDNLRLRKRFTVVRDSLLEKKYRQVSLRAHIFNNLLEVYGSSTNVTPADDERLGDKARLRLEQLIPRYYDWFVNESVDAVLRHHINCTRAAEKPSRNGRVSFGPTLPNCIRAKNKHCHVERFIREHAPAILPDLRQLAPEDADEAGDQLSRTCDLFEAVIANPAADLSHSDCRRAGDCLIALEAKDHATHAVSTNAKEWRPLCNLLGIEFIHVTYPNEKTA